MRRDYHFLTRGLLLFVGLLGCGDSGPAEGGADTGGGGSSTGGSPTTTTGGTGGDGGGDSGGNGGASAGGMGGAGGGPVLPNPCDCTSTMQVGAVMNQAISETSGLAASVLHPGAVYLHEDSGSASVFYAMDLSGAPLAELEISNVNAVDMEAIAVGSCPEGSCLYIADVGDNLEQRDDYRIYRIAEPAAFSSTQTTATVLPFSYEDGSNNCEAFVVEPGSGNMYLLTKTNGTPGLYRIDTMGNESVAVRLFDVPAPDGNLFTAADVRPDGQGLLVRTYGSLFYYAGNGVEAALATEPCEAPVADEAQGEAVAFIEGGLNYITVSEGTAAAINRSVCD